MANSYQLGNENFKTRKELMERVKGVLHDPKNFRKDISNIKDIKLLKELIVYHPEAKEKIGCGIKKIQVNHNRFDTISFHLERLDGTKDDFSYPECIKNYPNKGL